MQNPLANKPLTQGVLGNFIFQVLWYAGGVAVTTLTGYSAYVKELPLWAVSLISVSTLWQPCGF
ncbi:MAG: hypothetical protein IPL32_20265 [Chloracidobacterium sp.]|nr:hypothetical protein [Chloracidobacterium sp.]